MYGFMRGDKYIGMDYSSGGYPWEAEYLPSIKMWKTVKEAEEYRAIFKRETFTHTEEWILKEICVKDIGR
jgi:hypothetical protein